MSDIIRFMQKSLYRSIKKPALFLSLSYEKKNNKYVDAGEIGKEKKQKEISYTITTKRKIAQIFQIFAGDRTGDV